MCKYFTIKDIHVKESLRLCIDCQPIREIHFLEQTHQLTNTTDRTNNKSVS